MNLIKFCLDPKAYADHKIKQRKADKAYRARKAAEAKAGKEALKAAREAEKFANAPPKSQSKAKARAMASGHGLSSVKDLIRQVYEAEELGPAAAVNILARHGAKKVQDLQPKDYEAVREACRHDLIVSGHGAAVDDDEPDTLIPETMADTEIIDNMVVVADAREAARKPKVSDVGRSARNLAQFKEACRLWFPMFNEDDLVEAQHFVTEEAKRILNDRRAA